MCVVESSSIVVLAAGNEMKQAEVYYSGSIAHDNKHPKLSSFKETRIQTARTKNQKDAMQYRSRRDVVDKVEASRQVESRLYLR